MSHDYVSDKQIALQSLNELPALRIGTELLWRVAAGIVNGKSKTMEA